MVIKVLIASEANFLENNNGKTPLDVADTDENK